MVPALGCIPDVLEPLLVEPILSFSDRLMTLASPWPSIFAFDFGRYLVAAIAITSVLTIASSEFIDIRRVRQRVPRASQVWHEFRHSVATAAVFSLVGLGVYYGVDGGVFRVYSDPARYGWLYWSGNVVLIIVAHDAYFYWTHRAMHAPRIFVRVHRTHHLSVTPTQWAAYSFSIGEALAQSAFLPIFLLVVPTSTCVLFIWMAHQVLRNVTGHCGVELVPRSWLATWWGRWLTTTLHHDMHHAHGRHNYGLYFAWWDRRCGTEHPDYRQRLAELLRAIESVHSPAGEKGA